MNFTNSVNVSVETTCESKIQEIGYDGTEIYEPPPTLSETLKKCAAKIDFSKTSLEELKKEEKAQADEADKDAQFQPSLWPWDSVRNKLNDALTEVCVLADVISIAKDKRYLVLDPVPDTETEKNNAIIQVYSRKKALNQAAQILLSGAERLKNTHTEQRNRNVSDFHIELLRLRQNWRLKKVSNAIIGDLSYRTAGSKFGMSGTFEVTKAEDVADEEAAGTSTSLTTTGANNGLPNPSPKNNSALRVIVPAELQGVAYFKVITQKDQEDLCTATVNLMGHGPNTTQQGGVWQKTIEDAQNVLFCKELFSQLAREAIQLQAPIPHVVIGNQIRATLLPGIQLIISLCHSTSVDSNQPTPINDHDHDHVLEHSLHQLLREVHHKNSHHPFPHPASGPLGPSKKRMLAGPMASDRQSLVEMTKYQTILEQIIAQAQHIFMRKRTQYVLDTLARDVKDPQIVSHWNAMTSPTMSCVKINIVTHGYDTINRTSLVIHVRERSLKAICRDGRVMHLSYEPQELRDLILCQINSHQISCLLNLARCMAWQVLSNSNHLGIGKVEPLGNASSCLLASPNSDRMIAVQIRCTQSQMDVKVYIAKSPRQDFFPNPLVPEKFWENLGGHFKEVRFDKIEGKSFLNKMEFLMASLNSSSA
ncbi:mediator of RNA polymerase II transcription subunit 17 [Lucilia sericata]|uniref:mediator of RNA polymerase II transcription subunit 17 n=1 Tax=Lucilia sericata TaxID=13632 RepID=UPI0018A80351|nr:mediator of RNA polymerase II transcription subunit 17 [Lucilia sericata]